MSALLALLLGTGLTASAVYITMVATVIPILKSAGVSDMAAHMFAFYFGVSLPKTEVMAEVLSQN